MKFKGDTAPRNIILGGAVPYLHTTIDKGHNKTFNFGKGLYHFWLDNATTPLSYYIFTDEVSAIVLNTQWNSTLLEFTSVNGNLNVAVDAGYNNLVVKVRKLILET